MKKKLLFVLVTIMAFALFAPNAMAAVINEQELRDAIANGDTTIEIGANIIVKDATITLDRDITISGGTNKYKISSSEVKKLFTVEQTGTEIIKVKFENVELEDTVVAGRCIDIRTGNIELTLDNAKLVSTTSGNNEQKDRPLNVGGTSANQENAIINIKNSTLISGTAGYGMMLYNPVNLTIDNSTITGYGSLYFKAADGSVGTVGSVVNVKNNSKIISNNIYDGETNNFGAFIFEDENIKVSIEKSTIEANSTKTALSIPFIEQVEKENAIVNEVIVSGDSEIIVNAENEETLANSIISSGTVKLTIESGVESNLEIKDEYLKEEDAAVYAVETPEGDIKYVVATEEEITKTPYIYESITDKETLKEVTKELDEVLTDIDEEIAELEKIENKTDEELKVLELLKQNKGVFLQLKEIFSKRNMLSFSDIIYGSLIGENLIINQDEQQPNGNVKVILEIPEIEEKVKEGYTRKYSVIRFHINEDDTIELKELEANEFESGKISFETDKFSTYILVYEDVLNVTNPDTLDGVRIYIVLGLVSLIGVSVVGLYLKKNRIFN